MSMTGRCHRCGVVGPHEFWPRGERYEILAGHTRKRSATKAGISKVWCWVEDLDDESAYMLLATSNNQGELSPLEIGLHALRNVYLSKGGRGKKGGLSEYAEKVGKSNQYIGQVKAAAEVLTTLEKPPSQLGGFLDKAQHLAAIHKLPRACWASCAEAVVEKGMSVVEVEERRVERRRMRANAP